MQGATREPMRMGTKKGQMMRTTDGGSRSTEASMIGEASTPVVYDIEQ
jgi:hypothetical protein